MVSHESLGSVFFDPVDSIIWFIRKHEKDLIPRVRFAGIVGKKYFERKLEHIAKRSKKKKKMLLAVMKSK